MLGVIIAFIVIIFLIRKQFNFGASLIIGSLILGVFSLQTIQPVDIPKAMVEATIYSFEKQQLVTETIELALLMTLIYVLAKSMQETGSIKKLISSLRTIFSKGGILGVTPAVYGLMPVPGGALFSAPMLDEEGDKYKLDKNQKNMLNMWFRHIWFPVYPISSAMILICSTKFSDINIYSLMLINMPAFIASILIGLFLLKKFIGKTDKQNGEKREYNGLIYLIPPVTPLFFYGVLRIVDFPETTSFLIGIIVSIVVLYFLTKIKVKEYLQILKKSLTWKLALAIFGIMIFRQMFEVSKANEIIAGIIGGFSAPALAMIILIPLLLGFITGYNLGAIALSYFLVQPFFQATGLSILGLTSIIFISSLVGYLISPIHLCNVLSSDYLKTDPTRIYKFFVPSALSLIVIQVLFVFLIGLFQ
jgi:integral membrane protein (TIGR00529 family)